jgi:ABC-type transporter Mla subunit MlaD
VLAQDPRLAQRVGAIALVVMIGAIAGVVFLLDRLELGAPVRIRVVFERASGLHERAPFVVAGQPVGRIEAIAPVVREPLLGGGIGVAVTVAIDGDQVWKVPAAGEVFVASRGALSDRYLEIAPPPVPGPPVRDGQAIRGVDPPSLDNVLQRSWTNMTIFKLFVEAVRPELDALRAEVRQLAAQVAALPAVDAAAARALIAAARTTYAGPLGGAPGVAALRAMLDDARATTAQLRAAIAVLAPRVDALVADAVRIHGHLAASDPVARTAQAIASLRAALDQLDPLVAHLAELSTRLAAGEGSLGRLMTDPEFPEDAKDLGKIIKRHPWRILEKPAN